MINRVRSVHIKEDELIALTTPEGHKFSITMNDNQVHVSPTFGGSMWVRVLKVDSSESQLINSVVGVLLD